MLLSISTMHRPLIYRARARKYGATTGVESPPCVYIISPHEERMGMVMGILPHPRFFLTGVAALFHFMFQNATKQPLRPLLHLTPSIR